jgi:uncharacterized protein
MRKHIGRWLPSPEALRAKRSLRWLGPLLERPWLWRLNRRSVAVGAGIGVFFGLLVPVLQIALAALFAVLLRANLPVAAVSTLVSNPFTYAPIFVAAYRVGAGLLGEPAGPMQSAILHSEASEATATEKLAPSWWRRFSGVGKPLMLGLALFAVIGGASAYVGTLILWRLSVILRRRRRRARRLS